MVFKGRARDYNQNKKHIKNFLKNQQINKHHVPLERSSRHQPTYRCPNYPRCCQSTSWISNDPSTNHPNLRSSNFGHPISLHHWSPNHFPTWTPNSPIIGLRLERCWLEHLGLGSFLTNCPVTLGCSPIDPTTRPQWSTPSLNQPKTSS